MTCMCCLQIFRMLRVAVLGIDEDKHLDHEEVYEEVPQQKLEQSAKNANTFSASLAYNQKSIICIHIMNHDDKNTFSQAKLDRIAD